MNAHKKTLVVSRERLRMTHSLCLTTITFVIIAAILALFAARVHCAEIYTSAGSSFPQKFDNPYQKHDYEVSRMDATYFAGREIVFFTMETDTGSKKYLHYYTPGFSDTYDHIDLGITDPTQIYFKTAVFNNVLYIFYTSSDTSVYRSDTIYYRTLTVDYGTSGTDWNLTFSDEKSLPSGIPVAVIRFAKVMNGKLYVMYCDSYTYGSNWYYISSTDGLTFGPGTLFFSGPSPSWTENASGEIFLVPDDAEGFKERLMIGYTFYPGGPVSYIYYFFFDGQSGYGLNSIQIDYPYIQSVRLFAGTAEGYTNNKYVIQVFCAAPYPTSYRWSYMYHGEYTPSGTDGASGDWTPTWTKLSLSSHDQVYGVDEPAWAIIPYFEDEGTNQRMNLRIWYAKDSEYTYEMFGQSYQTIKFQSSTYKSDLLEHADDTLPPQEADMSTSPVLGVILGTPPYPINNGVPTADPANTSTVVLKTDQTVTFQTTWTATAGTAVSYGKKFGPVNMQAKLSAGVKRSKESARGEAIHQMDTLRSYNYMSYPGGLGWVLFLQPGFLTEQYILRSYNGNPLAYDGKTDELRVSLITYDESNTTLQRKAFYLDKPSDPMGGTDYSTQIFAGMLPVPLSNNVDSWRVPVTSTDSYEIFRELKKLQSTQGDQSYTEYVETTTDAVTNGWNAGFSASAGAFGFTADGNVNFSMDFKTTTTMTQSLGFGYAVPACGPPDSVTPCISDMTVYPYILVPNDDATGYDAPWISDDIYNFQKPKPWCISYWVASPPSAATNLAATRIAVQKVQGTLFLDEGEPGRDKLTAKIRLIVPRGFLMNRDEWLHLRFGNYFTDSNVLEVISREFKGQNLVLKLKGQNSDSSITVRVSYNRNNSILDINLDADRIDLTPLYAYKFLGAEKPTERETDFGLYLGAKYFANSELDVHCAVNDQNAICNFHSK